MKHIMKKYFEILHKFDYNPGIEEELKDVDTLEHFNELLDSVISEMSHDDLILSIKQSFKRDSIKGLFLGEEDEIWDELNEWIEEQPEVQC